VCLACQSIVEPWERQAIIPKDRPGTDPTMREETASGLRHVTVPQTGTPAAPTPPTRWSGNWW
jgi:hypothetical protein